MPAQSPPMEKVVAECCLCARELYESDEVIYDVEGSVYYCDDNCLADYIRKHPREFIDLMIENNLLEKNNYVDIKK